MEHPGRAESADDRLEIHALVQRYAAALDARDGEAFETLWTDDGVMEVFQDGVNRPRTARLRARRHLHLAFEQLERYQRTIHHVTTHHATIAGHDGTGMTYCEAHHLEPSEADTTTDLVMHIRYVDTYRRTDRWRFRLRRVELLMTEQRAVHHLP